MTYTERRYRFLRGQYPTERACDILRHIRAEDVRREMEWHVDWSPDCETSAEFSDEKPAYRLWECTIWHIPRIDAYSTHRNPIQEIVTSCGCVDLGRMGHPGSSFHARMIAADLIMEAALSATEAIEKGLIKSVKEM